MGVKWILALPLALSLQCTTLCDLSLVPSTQLGNNRCDLQCNNVLCDFDSVAQGKSDCSQACEASGCPAALLGNHKCDSQCNNPHCGFDQGECGFCAPGCFFPDLLSGFPPVTCRAPLCQPTWLPCAEVSPECVGLRGNGECDLQCFTDRCAYDGLDCGMCAPLCALRIVGDGTCDLACLTELCAFDGGDCSTTLRHNCSEAQVGNAVCDEACYQEDTNWDGGDCDCAPGCSRDLLQNTNCDQVCAVPACNFDLGFCVFAIQGTCSAGCFPSMLGDGECQAACWVQDCGFDGEDCGCSPSCSASKSGLCEVACLTPKCAFDNFGKTGGCRDASALRLAFYWTASKEGDLNWSSCLETSPSCTFSALTAAVTASACLEECRSEACLWAGGLCEAGIPKCQRVVPGGCLECPSGLFNFHLKCVSACPHSYEAVLSFCFPISDHSSAETPDVLRVKTVGEAFTSLGQALASARLRYTVIFLLDAFVDAASEYDSSDPLANKTFQNLTLTTFCDKSECVASTVSLGKLHFACSGNVTLAFLQLTVSSPLSQVFTVLAGGQLTLTNIQAQVDSLTPALIMMAGGNLLFLNISFTQRKAATGVLVLQTQPGGRFLLKGVTLADSQLTLLRLSQAVSVMLSMVDLRSNTAEELVTVSVGAVEVIVHGLSASNNQAKSVLWISNIGLAVLSKSTFANNTSDSLLHVSAVSAHFSFVSFQNNSAFFALQVENTSLLRLWAVEVSGQTNCRAGLNVASTTIAELGPLLLKHSNCTVGLTLTAILALVRGLVSESNIGRAVLIHSDNVSLVQSRITHSSGPSAVLFQDCASLLIANCTLAFNQGEDGAAVLLENVGVTQIVDCFFTNNSAKADSGAGLHIKGKTRITMTVQVVKSVFADNSAFRGGALCLSSIEPEADFQLFLISVQFRNNSADISGSALFIGEKIRLLSSLITDCLFVDNNSPDGTIVLQFDRGNLTFNGTQFLSNRGILCSDISIEHAFSCALQLLGCLWQSSFSPALRQPLGHPDFTLFSQSCIFLNSNNEMLVLNTAQWTDFGSRFIRAHASPMLLTAVNATLANSQFHLNFSPDRGGAMTLTGGSNLTCINCMFTENQAALAGGAVYIEENASVKCLNCVFLNNSAKVRGGAVFLFFSLSSFSVFSNCTFENNEGADDGVISAVGAGYFLTNCTLRGNKGSQNAGLSVVLGVLAVKDSLFENQKANLVAFIYLGTSSIVTLTSCIFRSTASSALFAFTSKLQGEACTFNNISSTQGGVIYAMEHSSVIFQHSFAYNISVGGLMRVIDSNLTLHNCTFREFQQVGVLGAGLLLWVTNCSFEKGNGTLGGALSLTNSKIGLDRTSFLNCSAERGGAFYMANAVALLQDCYFEHNNARLGGALYAESDVELTDNHSLFLSNSALQGGAVYLGKQTNIQLNSSSFISNIAKQGGAIMWTSLQPTLQNCSYKENQADYGADQASFPVQLQLKSPCDVSPCSIFKVPPGQKLPVSIAANLVDHMNQVYNVDSSSIAFLSPINASTASAQGMMKSISNKGEFAWDDLAILGTPGDIVAFEMNTSAVQQQATVLHFYLRNCLPGEILYERTSCLSCAARTFSLNASDESCKECPENARCPGGNSIIPDPGYWRLHTSEEVIQCPNSAACLGQPSQSSKACAEGYQGNLCQPCRPGYSHTARAVCAQCPSTTGNAVYLSIGGLLVLCVIWGVVYLVFRFAEEPTSKELNCCKILLNFFQILGCINTDFWPEELRYAFDLEQRLGLSAQQLASVDCLLAERPLLSGSYFFSKMLVVALLPLALMGIALLVLAGAALVRSNRKVFAEKWKGTCVVVYFLSLSFVLRQLFSMLSCVEVQRNERWVSVDLSISCWQGDHQLYTQALAVPAIALWGFVVPLFCLFYTWRNIEKAEERKFQITYGFLTSGYRTQIFFWEHLLLLRKGLCTFISVFSTMAPSVQALALQLVLLLFLVLQIRYKPFDQPQSNHIELAALITLNCTNYCALFGLTDSLPTWGLWLLLGFVALANSAFLVFWLYSMRGIGVSAYHYLRAKLKGRKKAAGGSSNVKPGPAYVSEVESFGLADTNRVS